jgi:hypothetical protein
MNIKESEIRRLLILSRFFDENLEVFVCVCERTPAAPPRSCVCLQYDASQLPLTLLLTLLLT